MSEQKSKGSLFFSIVILLILVTALGYLVNDRILNNNEDTSINLQQKPYSGSIDVSKENDNSENSSDNTDELFDMLSSSTPREDSNANIEESSSEDNESKQTIDLSDNQDDTNSGEQAETTKYVLKSAQSNKIDNIGLMPSTPVAIITNKTSSTINYERCTIAFSLSGKGGMPWAITAGHCGNYGDKVYSIPNDGNWNNSYFLGTVRYTSKTNYDTGKGDWGAIRLYPKVTRPAALGKVPMFLYNGNVSDGTSLCKNGARTGYTCGIQGIKNIKAILGRDSNNNQITGKLDEIKKICALPGDSGSPVFSDDGIVGVLSSTGASSEESKKGSCNSPSSAYYVPIDIVIEQIRQEVPDIIFKKNS